LDVAFNDAPDDLGMRRPKLNADFARRFSDDFQVTASSVKQEGFGHGALPREARRISSPEGGNRGCAEGMPPNP
jgi:hypothetical protein